VWFSDLRRYFLPETNSGHFSGFRKAQKIVPKWENKFEKMPLPCTFVAL
jgi:hypothetical protein